MTTKRAHTPGPWREISGMVVILDDQRPVCSIDVEHYIFGNGKATDNEERRSNARLIASAPDLMAVNAELVKTLEQISEWLIRPNDYELNAARNVARAAIAKAKEGK